MPFGSCQWRTWALGGRPLADILETHTAHTARTLSRAERGLEGEPACGEGAQEGRGSNKTGGTLEVDLLARPGFKTVSETDPWVRP